MSVWSLGWEDPLEGTLSHNVTEEGSMNLWTLLVASEPQRAVRSSPPTQALQSTKRSGLRKTH